MRIDTQKQIEDDNSDSSHSSSYMYIYMTNHSQELEMRIDTQKQTLTARDESIKKLLEMLQNKGEGEMRIIIMFKKRKGQDKNNV